MSRKLAHHVRHAIRSGRGVAQPRSTPALQEMAAHVRAAIRVDQGTAQLSTQGSVTDLAPHVRRSLRGGGGTAQTSPEPSARPFARRLATTIQKAPKSYEALKNEAKREAKKVQARAKVGAAGFVYFEDGDCSPIETGTNGPWREQWFQKGVVNKHIQALQGSQQNQSARLQKDKPEKYAGDAEVKVLSALEPWCRNFPNRGKKVYLYVAGQTPCEQCQKLIQAFGAEYLGGANGVGVGSG